MIDDQVAKLRERVEALERDVAQLKAASGASPAAKKSRK